MAKRALVIEVRLLADRYHGVGDWPPSPFRLFQAMVAGAYGGRWIPEPREAKDAAFLWLENLAPPCIMAPAHVSGRIVQSFVPNNDLDALGGDPRRVGEIRSQKQTQALLLANDTPFTYAWPFDEQDAARADALCGLVERLHTFGRGVDGAFARVQTLEWDAAIDALKQAGGVAFPHPSVGIRRAVRCPAPGSFQSLMERYARQSKQLEALGNRAASSLFRQPPKARCVVVAYDRSPTRYLFDIRPAEDATTFRALPQVRAVEVAKASRDLAFGRLSQAMAERSPELERVLIGRGAPPPDASRRVRFVPLPSTGSRNVDAAIRRVLVEVPPECPLTPADVAWSLSGQSLDPFVVASTETGELRDALLVPSEDERMLRHYGVERKARRWQSMTPVALPQRVGPRRGGKARASADAELTSAVVDALRHGGFPYRGVQVRVQREPFSRHGDMAPAFASGRFAPATLYHVDVTFADPVEGPLVIGDGRWLGLGVMAPVAEATPSVHIFHISGGDWPVSDTTLVTRAIRRAVMSRAGEVVGPRRRLPVFFAGHDDTDAPVRGEVHAHLFFLAYDANEDGLLDVVAIVAPHLADRRSSQSTSSSERRQLVRALEGLQFVRAGRLGVMELRRLDAPPGELFSPSAIWESVTPYRPTRHPKRGTAPQEALAVDLTAECARRGLPRPEIALLAVTEGPRGGLQCRARLTFSHPVPGPLLLGPGSHFGEGLFRRPLS